MAGPKSRIIQKGLGALGNIYDQLNLSRFGKGDKPYPEPDWDKAQGWEEYVKQLQLRDQALADKGALANLGDAPIDESKRTFMKGAVAAPVVGAGALIGLKGASKLIDEVPAAVETVVEGVAELPSELQHMLEKVPTVSSYKWINKLYHKYPKLRQSLGKDLQKEYVDEMGVDEMKEAGYKDFWFNKDPNSFEDIFKEVSDDQFSPAIDFELMGPEFNRELDKFIAGKKNKPGTFFSEFLDSYIKDQKSQWPEDSIKTLRKEAKQHFMRQLISEDIERGFDRIEKLGAKYEPH